MRFVIKFRYYQNKIADEILIMYCCIVMKKMKNEEKKQCSNGHPGLTLSSYVKYQSHLIVVVSLKKITESVEIIIVLIWVVINNGGWSS